MTVQLIHVGEFKENHYAAAAAEYVRRLGAFCDFIDTPVKETKISDERSAAEVSKHSSPRAYAYLPQSNSVRIRWRSA